MGLKSFENKNLAVCCPSLFRGTPRVITSPSESPSGTVVTLCVSGAQALGGCCCPELMLLTNRMGILVEFTGQPRGACLVLWTHLRASPSVPGSALMLAQVEGFSFIFLHVAVSWAAGGEQSLCCPPRGSASESDGESGVTFSSLPDDE